MPLLRRKGLYETGRVIYLHPDVLHPNPNQPRKRFSPDGLEELAASIREHGVLQPLTVRKVDGSFELVSGERRLRAARMAGLSEVPCIVIDVDGVCSSLLALVDRMEQTAADPAHQTVFISHGDCLADAEYVAKRVREKFGVKNIYINFVGPVIGAHSGPGTVALFFIGEHR